MLAVVTCSDYPNLTGDDTPLVVSELQDCGVNTEAVVWDASNVDWHSFSAVIVRSAWDYSYRHLEFLTWIDRIHSTTQVWNPPEIMKWNSHKRYLLDLQAKGVPILPTEWLPLGRSADLVRILEQRKWDTVVIKPAVSANARRTIVVNREQVHTGQAHLERWLPERDMMVQAFEPSIVEKGERSLIFIADEFTHAVVKQPAAGDYRIQESYGGTARLTTPTPAELKIARTVLDAIGQPLLYARIDLIGQSDRVAAIEVELVEPSLYLQYVPELIPEVVAKMVAFLQARGIDLHS
ncbi:MAG: RimK family alpha-L-glutamate ligase [Synechococcus sp.]